MTKSGLKEATGMDKSDSLKKAHLNGLKSDVNRSYIDKLENKSGSSC